MFRLPQQVPPGPYPPAMIVRRGMLGMMALFGLFVILGTEFERTLTGGSHSLSMLAFGVSLILMPVLVAAIISLTELRRSAPAPSSTKAAS